MKRRWALLFIGIFAAASATAWAMDQQQLEYYRDQLSQILPEAPSFKQWIQKTGALPPDFDALPRCNSLPDPFTFFDGHRVQSSDDWQARRAEIMQLEEKYDFGKFPPKSKLAKAEVTSESQGKGYVTRAVKLEFGPDVSDQKATLRVQITIPEGTGPMPVLIAPSLAGWAPNLVRRGYISVGYAASDFADDTGPLVEMYPDFDFAKLPRRAWVVQTVIDYLETVPQVDRKHIAIFGYSRDGKMAAIAAALDERIAACIAGSTGVGGVLPWRCVGERGFGESIESTTRSFPDWFAPQLRFFAGREDRLPVDGNLIVAMIAPRACLIEYGDNDQVSHCWGMEQCYYSAMKVYQLLHKPEALNIFHLPGFHGANDQEACIDWLDIQFDRSDRKWDDRLQFRWDVDKWQNGPGQMRASLNPEHKPDDLLTTGDGSPISSKQQWETKADSIRKELLWMLGDEPPRMPLAGRGLFGGRGGPPGAGRGGPGANAPPGGPGTAGGAIAGGAATGANGSTGAARHVCGRSRPNQTRPGTVGHFRGGNSYGWLKAQADQTTSRSMFFGYGVRADLYYPAGTPEGTKLATVIWLHGYSFPLGYMWVYHNDLHPILALVKAGYAVLAFDQSGFGSRINEFAPFYQRYPNWSLMGRMVEDTRAAVDALQKDNLVDPQRIYLFGYSLGGMVALHTAALEPKVAGVVSLCGFTPMRTDTADKGTGGIARYCRDFPLIPRLNWYLGEEARLHYDYDELIGAIAPRPVYVFAPQLDRDANPADVHAAVDRAKKVYRLYEAEEKLQLDEPWDYNRLPTASQDRIIEWMSEKMH